MFSKRKMVFRLIGKLGVAEERGKGKKIVLSFRTKQKSSKKIEKVLGKAGLGVIRKIFGVVLLAIAVKLFATNILSLFEHS